MHCDWCPSTTTFCLTNGDGFMVEKSQAVRWGKFQFTEHEIERQIAEATRRGTEELRTEPLATAVHYDAKARRVVVELNKGTTLTVPVDLLQGLQAASPRDLAQVEIVGPGVAIEWPNLDQQFSIMGLLAGVFGTRAWTAKLARRRAPAVAKTKATTPASRTKGGKRRKARQGA